MEQSTDCVTVPWWIDWMDIWMAGSNHSHIGFDLFGVRTVATSIQTCEDNSY